MTMTKTIYQMKVKEVHDLTPLVRELQLECVNPEQFKFRAGQFVMLHVPQAEGKPALRAYSIASDERSSTGFRLLFKFVENGKASQFVWGLSGGETLQFTGPFGRVFFQEPPTEQIVFLNTGTGLSQHLSYLYSKKEQYNQIQYRMLFGVRSEEEMYFKNQLDLLAQDFGNFKYEFVLSRPSSFWKGKKGYVQHFLSELNYKEVPTTFYLCGNGGMIKEVKQQLIENEGFDKTRIWAEAFD